MTRTEQSGNETTRTVYMYIVWERWVWQIVRCVCSIDVGLGYDKLYGHANL